MKRLPSLDWLLASIVPLPCLVQSQKGLLLFCQSESFLIHVLMKITKSLTLND